MSNTKQKEMIKQVNKTSKMKVPAPYTETGKESKMMRYLRLIFEGWAPLY